jgi:DNA invertase Pin-like site-specific DNA recombinase
MSNSGLVQPQHLSRKAVIYIRQSTGHQVLTNQESGRMQLAMKEHARRLGWDDHLIEVVEADTGISGKTTAGRDGYKNLLSEVALGQVGVVLSYESARLSRNCSDWYPLLDLCTYRGCLIADRDGIYDASTANGRLLLGMKGILSEIELHTLRGRLVAGVRNKASRGELALSLPAGLIRLEDGRVVKDPNVQVQRCIELVFSTFIELKSTFKVARRLNESGLQLPRRHRNQETIWRPPSVRTVNVILHNPAYAGAFVYGKTRMVPAADQQGNLGRSRVRPCAIGDWSIVVKDRYPAYITWETFERIQAILRDNHADYVRKGSRGVPRDGAALLHGIVFCGHCGHKMPVQYKGTCRYVCNYLYRSTHSPVCQYMQAEPIDQKVSEAFLAALAPVELDLYERAMERRGHSWSEVMAAQDRDLQRLRYEVDLAHRQYNKVDPDNRLVAGELERRWEVALRALREAEARIGSIRAERDKVVPLHVPRELRAAFSGIGETLPTLWRSSTITLAQRKALIRCLIDKVVLERSSKWEIVNIRIVWRGGAVSEIELPVSVKSLRSMSTASSLEREILVLQADGLSDDEIAEQLTQRGFHSPMAKRLLSSTVKTVRLRNGHLQRYRGPRPRRVPGFLTLPQVAKMLNVPAQWIHYLIHRGTIQIDLDPKTNLYLFPDKPEMLEQLRQLRDRLSDHVSD